MIFEKMQHERWYDKNEILKQIIEILENSDPVMRNDLANDIIQLIVNKENDVDNFIQVINEQNPPKRTRWYDKDETMYSVVEMLKNINENEKKGLYKEILTNILNFENE